MVPCVKCSGQIHYCHCCYMFSFHSQWKVNYHYLYSDWKSGSRLNSAQCEFNCSRMHLSTTLDRNDRLLKGLWFFFISSKPNFFRRGLTIAVFHLSIDIHSVNDLLIISFTYGSNIWLHVL